MKYLLLLLLVGCAPLDTRGLTFEQRMSLYDRGQLQHRPIQAYQPICVICR